jgi:hypothetical protein
MVAIECIGIASATPVVAQILSRDRAASPPPAAPADAARGGGRRTLRSVRPSSRPRHRTPSRHGRRRRSSRCSRALRSSLPPGADFLTTLAWRGRSSWRRPAAWSVVRSRPKSRRAEGAAVRARGRGAGPRRRGSEAARHVAGASHAQRVQRGRSRHPAGAPECDRCSGAG